MKNLGYLVLVATAIAAMSLMGCSGFQVSQGVHSAVADAVTVAQDELPGLQAVGVFSAGEAAVATGFINGVSNLNNQFESCYTNAQQTTLKTAGKFVACLNIFAAGLNNPQELAALKVLNPKAQAKVQLWAGFFAATINIAITNLGGMTNPTPVIAPTPATSAEIRDFALRAGVAYGR